MEKLLNEENDWNNDTSCNKVEGLCKLIRNDAVLKALKSMYKDKADGPTLQY